MSFYNKMKSRSSRLANTAADRADRLALDYVVPAVPRLLDMGERYGGAAAFGFDRGYRAGRTQSGAASGLIGGALTITAAVLSGLSGGKSKLAPHLNCVGDAGMMSCIDTYFMNLGARLGHRDVFILQDSRPPYAPVEMLGGS